MASRHFVKSLASIEHCGACAAALEAHACCWLTGADSAGGGAASAGRDPPKSLSRIVSNGRRKNGGLDLHVGDTVTDNASTSNTSGGASGLSKQTRLSLLLHASGRSVCHGRGSMRWVRRSRGLSGLLVRGARRSGRASGRAGRS